VSREVVYSFNRATIGRQERSWRPIWDLDPKLINLALKLSGERTKRATVTRALEEFIARRRQKDLLKLRRLRHG
jgi:Bacterial antitoxin of type II TA system, VapB